jgi:hypothetical protein
MNKLDDPINFNEKEHKYSYKGHIFSISVTKFVHDHFPHFDEDEVINNILNSKKMEDPTYEYYGMDKKAILKYWQDSRDLGTLLHAQIEDYYLNGRIHKDINTIEYSYFKNFARDHSYLNIHKTEARIFSIELDIAGSVDLIVNNPDGTHSIIDWKRAKNIDTSTQITKYTKFSTVPELSHIINTNFNHYCFQLNVYKYILEKEYGYKILHMALLVFHPNNKSRNYEMYNVPHMDNEMDIIMNKRRESKKMKVLNLF